ncbi:dihydrolipoamide acetyltransferase family protein [Sphingobacterium griseoflavum]|uniref:Dihydrolipoamide acetyltransferase component of pyruvate dehydrogenase complex n=1 Tax=Sphingobacterium griseoflavum TaxID=1474952 RepID=A0ABQ3HQE9_9SPHI|nr:dihydrolipoamide acetyltransferase family protein [Sphingobacterium griseoflavum]GHE23074.1 dihydrolipoamide acetyltransferase component of pyruvate dehydrogenase complex [Sphingobacterium griseoflavum]
MAIYKLLLPKMGESVSEATITKWVKAVGDTIAEDEAVVEIATDKVDSDVPSPVVGKLSKILFEENKVVQVGDVIALIEVEGNDDAVLRDEDDAMPNFVAPGPVVDEEVIEADPSSSAEEFSYEEVPGVNLLDKESEELPNQKPNGRFYSPLVKNIAQEEGLSKDELDQIAGSGAEGRVTKQDVLDYLNNANRRHAVKTPVVDDTSTGDTTSVSTSIESQKSVQQPALPTTSGDEIIEMDRMRRLIADHMVHSVKTSPHVASFVEADVTHLVNWRNKVKDSYKQREGENITFTPLFIEAISKAIKDFPMINVSVDGHRIIKKKHIHIGMAAALPTGNLIVPVIKNADQLSLVGLSKAVNDLAYRSRSNKLKPDDTQGGTFTFSNIGAFGNIMGFPIINQPQAAILAVGTIKKRPAVLETADGDVIAIRHMMYLSMSYDHRVIDGALGGMFLKRVADYLESWDVNREI